MNPLCCIAPVSLDRGERGNSPVVTLKAKPPAGAAAAVAAPGVENQGRNLSSKQLLLSSGQIPSLASDSELGVSREAEEAAAAGEGSEGKGGGRGCTANGVVAGVLYKWVNYGKGWRSRWFVLQDGVLSYYKVHGPDKIAVGPVCEVGGVRVIGEDSLRRVRKDQAASGSAGRGTAKQWKPFGEIHLKVWCQFSVFFASSVTVLSGFVKVVFWHRSSILWFVGPY